jgi:hypothetical protein
MDEQELQARLEQAITDPKSSESDGSRVEEHSLRDLIEMDRYLAGKRSAAAAGGRGSGFKMLRAARGVPPGSV